MSAAEFDAYRDSYQAVVQESIDFSGLEHGFFLRAKAVELARLFRDAFGIDHKPTLLDVGCGVGAMHTLLGPITSRITGTDTSADCLQRAAADNPDVDYRLSDGRALAFRDRAFDVALAVCVTHHVPPADWAGFVGEMARVVRPGGLVVLIEHNPWNPLTRLAVSRCPFDADAVLLDWRRARRLLASAGLEPLPGRHFLLLPSERAAARGAERLVDRLPFGAQYLAAGRAT